MRIAKTIAAALAAGLTIALCGFGFLPEFLDGAGRLAGVGGMIIGAAAAAWLDGKDKLCSGLLTVALLGLVTVLKTAGAPDTVAAFAAGAAIYSACGDVLPGDTDRPACLTAAAAATGFTAGVIWLRYVLG